MTLLDYFRHFVGHTVPGSLAGEEREAEIDRRINDMNNIELLAWIGDYINRSETGQGSNV